MGFTYYIFDGETYMSRLLIISNRLPFSLEKKNNTVVVRQSSGGLVSAIKSFFDNQKGAEQKFTEKVWIGSLDADREDWNMVNDMEAIKEDFSIEPVFPEAKTYSDYYNGFSNSVLWPLFHYFPSLADYKKEYYEAYEAINRQFAQKIIASYQPGDVIWVHDYQLLLLPKMIREELQHATIGFFLHIPFPSYEIFRLMPSTWKKEILEGMLGADLIGFHTQDYVQHFIQSAKMILAIDHQFNSIIYKSRVIRTDLFPIGIDYQKFREVANNKKVISISTKLEETFKGQKIIFSVDRLDYTKGLDYRLDGYQAFLESCPEWKEKVTFILNVIPSRDVIPAYMERKRLTEEKISTINGKFSSLQWQPIIYRFNHLEFEELCALYQAADVALITPLRDGMNLVAKEFIASCIDKGVLILSELAGAANELNEAILVNPTDTQEVAQSIKNALEMPEEEQLNRLSYMQKRLSDYNVIRWVDDFLEQLSVAKNEQQSNAETILDKESIRLMVDDFNHSSKRCILLDYDGTLSPIKRLPSLAMPGSELLELLTDLSKDPANEIVVISGRDSNILEKWLGHLPISLVAEHGALIRYKGENWQQQTATTDEWKEQIKPILQLFVSRCAGSFIEEKKNTLAWHYRNTHPDLGFVRSRELQNSLLQLTLNSPLQVIDGKKVLEVRVIGIDKGVTAQNIMTHFNPDFTLCIGDDTTDEDMFKVLRDKAYTIKIGSGNTAAQYTLPSQLDVFPLLKKFILPVRIEHYGYTQI